ncbi:very short patch repair endonuclease [Chryseobacterium camelliae]|uniref:very short patch repair endonuclease n=1 Tax=Chryseobacterium camelliae TaxID=1265445 RepID=UPI00285A2A6E|nr:very short patch repair endonuclease [Chryseobacterium camelliae]MDR6515851.1 DNA mismatch endonuclease (patch repair protein) [Chryseobacterium camelliae]
MVKYIFNTTPERSKIMSKIRSKNTKPEILFRKGLYSTGIRYRLNVAKLPGKPDLVIQKYKIAIFIDGDFWHGYKWEEKKLRIKSNADYWLKKIEGNMQRDINNNSALEKNGYKVFRFWEHQIKNNLQECISLVILYIKNNF